MRFVLPGRLKCAAGTADRLYFCPPDGLLTSGEKWRVTGIKLIPNAALTTNATDYVTLQAYKGASTALATARVTSSVGLTQGSAESLALSAGPADREIDSSSPLSVRVAHSGSGKDTDVSVMVEFEAVRY